MVSVKKWNFEFPFVISDTGLKFKILQTNCIVTDWPGKVQATQETFSFSWLLFAYSHQAMPRRGFEIRRFFLVLESVFCFSYDFACFASHFQQETTNSPKIHHKFIPTFVFSLCFSLCFSSFALCFSIPMEPLWKEVRSILERTRWPSV